MREIKFRFWGRFGEWEEPDEMEQKFIMLYGDDFAWEEWEPINNLFADTQKDGAAIMQFTGLRDKNGREIYEGDIVKRGEAWGVVVWSPDEMCFEIRENNHPAFAPVGAFYGHDGEWLFEQSTIEIIGNLYENPELLK